MFGFKLPRRMHLVPSFTTWGWMALVLVGCDQAATSSASAPATPPAAEPPVYSAGPDFEVIPVDKHVTTTSFPDGQTREETIYPADGYQFVVAYPKRPEAMQPDTGDSFVDNHFVAWSGQNAMVRLGRSRVAGREKMGFLLVGPVGGDYRVMRVSPGADLIRFSQWLNRRSLPNETFWTGSSHDHAIRALIHGPASDAPAVMSALEAIAMGRSPFVKQERLESDGRTYYQTRAVPEEESFKLRAKCAAALWLLTDGDRSGPLTAILEEQHRLVAAGDMPNGRLMPAMHSYDLRETSLVNPLAKQQGDLTLDDAIQYAAKLETLYKPVPWDVPPVYPSMPGQRSGPYFHPFKHMLLRVEKDADYHRLMIHLIKSEVEPISLMAGEYYHHQLLEDAVSGFYYWRQLESNLERSGSWSSVPEEVPRYMIALLERVVALTEQAPDRRATRIAVQRIRENAGGPREFDPSRPLFGPDLYPLTMKHFREDPSIQRIAELFHRLDQWAEDHPLTQEDRRMSNPGVRWWPGVQGQTQ